MTCGIKLELKEDKNYGSKAPFSFYTRFLKNI